MYTNFWDGQVKVAHHKREQVNFWGVLTTNSKLKNLMNYLRLPFVKMKSSEFIQSTRIGVVRALDLHYIGYKNKTQGKGYGIT